MLAGLALVLLTACNGGREAHFMKDKAYREQVHQDYEARMADYAGALVPFMEIPGQAGNDEPTDRHARSDRASESEVTLAEREALEFLYAYMPLADVTDYPTDYYLGQVRASFRTREEMEWKVPEREFRHFVLPIRVNNENLDTARTAFYRELKRRFDIIFMDHMMPGMDGIETMKRIRANGAKDKAEIPIIALTANAVSTARETFLSVGFDGFVSKPIELVELERVLRRVLPKAATSSLSLQEGAPEAVSAVQETPPSVKEQLRACGLDMEEAHRYCADDEEFYMTLLAQFVSETAEKEEKMQAFLADNDLKNYEIVVHALKNALKLIGSDTLSERAKELEFAAKDQDAAWIEAHHDALMADCRLLTDRLKPICGIPDDKRNSDPSSDVMEFLPEDPDDAVMEFEPVEGEEGAS